MDTKGNYNDLFELDYALSEHRLLRSNTEVGSPTTSAESYGYSRTPSELSSYSETNEMQNTSCEQSPQQWPISKIMSHNADMSGIFDLRQNVGLLDNKLEDEITLEDLQMMKERFSKLLLGEDMSGGGKGVSTAVTISNAITNLYATVFGQFRRLEPLSFEKKSMWRKEMNCLVSVCDYIYDPTPYVHGAEGSKKKPRPRADIDVNLPALQKLDAMLLEILDKFHKTEFWYIEKQKLTPKFDNLGSVTQATHPTEEKWWLPIPCVPPSGLSEKLRKMLHKTRKHAEQIHKAAKTINSSILSEMDVPEAYMATLPKTARTNLGDAVYHYMSTTGHFSPNYLLDCLEMKSEREAHEIADRVEASMHVWRRKACLQHSKPSWDAVSDLNADGDKNVILANRAESILRCLDQRYPELSQTKLDTYKIQYNKDIGQAILESYSRVLESLSFNVVARIDGVLYVDGRTDKLIQ